MGVFHDLKSWFPLVELAAFRQFPEGTNGCCVMRFWRCHYRIWCALLHLTCCTFTYVKRYHNNLNQFNKLQSYAKVSWLFSPKLPWTPTKAILGYVPSINLYNIEKKKRQSLTPPFGWPPPVLWRRPFRGRQRVCRVESFVIQQLGRSRRPAVENHVTSTRISRKTINWNIAPTSSISNPIVFRYLPKKMVRQNHVSVGFWVPGCFIWVPVSIACKLGPHLLSKVSNIQVTFTTGNLQVWTWSIIETLWTLLNELLLHISIHCCIIIVTFSPTSTSMNFLSPCLITGMSSIWAMNLGDIGNFREVS